MGLIGMSVELKKQTVGLGKRLNKPQPFERLIRFFKLKDLKICTNVIDFWFTLILAFLM